MIAEVTRCLARVCRLLTSGKATVYRGEKGLKTWKTAVSDLGNTVMWTLCAGVCFSKPSAVILRWNNTFRELIHWQNYSHLWVQTELRVCTHLVRLVWILHGNCAKGPKDVTWQTCLILSLSTWLLCFCSFCIKKTSLHFNVRPWLKIIIMI